MFVLLFSTLVCVVEYSIHMLFLQHYLQKRQSRSSVFFLSRAGGVLFCAAALVFVNTFQNSVWNVLTVFLLTLLLATVFFEGKWHVKVFLAAVGCTLSVISEVLTILMYSAVFAESMTETVAQGDLQISMTIISKMMLFMLVRIIFWFKKGTTYTKMSREGLLLYVLPVVTVADMVLMVQMDWYMPAEDGHQIFMALVCMGLIVCNITVFFVYDRNLQRYELERKLRKAEDLQRKQANYYMQLEQRLQENRKQMHDFNHHITMLEHLYRQSNEQADSYVQQLRSQLREQMNLSSFGVKNAAFDVILYEQTQRCKELGITLETQILYNDLSFLSYLDTCTIFANALDNAVQACSEVTDGERRIVLEVRRRQRILSIIVENTKQNPVCYQEGKLLSSKADRGNHGFGVGNIRRAVEQYGGMVSVEHGERFFLLAISIPLPLEHEKE